MNTRNSSKRGLLWMLIILLALAGFITWHMAGVHAGAPENGQAATVLQTGSQVTVRQEAYACNAPDTLSHSVAFKLAGADDKLRALVTQHECVLILPGQRLKVAALKDKLAQLESAGAPSPLWMAARELVLSDGLAH